MATSKGEFGLDEFGKRLRKDDIGHAQSVPEQGGNLFIPEAGNATANACDIEFQLGVSLGECDELVDVWLDGLNASLHCGDGVGLSLEPDSLPHYCAKSVHCYSGRAAAMMSGKVAAEDKYFVGAECADVFRCIFHSFIVPGRCIAVADGPGILPGLWLLLVELGRFVFF